MDLLKFITAGSVDDGKSTLIGRLLYDTDSILEDQLDAIRQANRMNEDGEIDLAILTDGLKAEREQGITIDVAYKYFQTDKRKFIIADTPGHIQYTRNMVTGASGANLAIILIDARKGVIEQTVRHSYLLGLLAIENLVICVNKMDMVDYDQAVFEKIKSDYLKIAEKLNLDQPRFIPICALRGDNIVNASESMPWYSGEPLLDILATVEVKGAEENAPGRFPVQWVIRPQTEELHDYRGYAGRVTSGRFSVGEQVVILPSGVQSTISQISLDDQELEVAGPGASVVLQLADDVDMSRGDLVVPLGDLPRQEKEVEANLCWMDTRPLDTSLVYLLQLNSKVIKVKIQEIDYKVNINTLEKIPTDRFELNDIGRVSLRFSEELAYDPYVENKLNGGGILIDSRTNLTVGAVLLN